MSATATTAYRSDTSDTARSVRLAGLWCAIGATVLTVGAAVSGIIPPAAPATDISAPFTPAVFRITQITWAACHLLVFVGILGLARSGATGASRLGQVGTWIAAVGIALIATCEVGFAVFATATLDSTPGMALNAIVGLATTAAGLGFLLTGIAVLRAGRWGGWHRFTPLLCGLFVFVILTPALAALPALFFWAIAGWSACLLLLGLALFGQGAASR